MGGGGTEQPERCRQSPPVMKRCSAALRMRPVGRATRGPTPADCLQYFVRRLYANRRRDPPCGAASQPLAHWHGRRTSCFAEPIYKQDAGSLLGGKRVPDPRGAAGPPLLGEESRMPPTASFPVMLRPGGGSCLLQQK